MAIDLKKLAGVYPSEEEMCKVLNKRLEGLALHGTIPNPFGWCHINNGEHPVLPPEVLRKGKKYVARLLGRAGKRAKAMGQKKGLLDYLCFGDNGLYFMEAKIVYKSGKKSYLEPEQKEFIKVLDLYNIPHTVFYCPEQAIEFMQAQGTIIGARL